MTEKAGSERRAMVLVIALGVVALLGALVVVTVVAIDRYDSDEQPQASPTTTAPPDLTAARAAEVEGAVNSRDPQQLAEVLVVEEGVDLDAVVADALPAEATLDIDETTFATQDGGVGTVEASISGPEPASVTLFLAVRDGRWVVVGSSAPVAS